VDWDDLRVFLAVARAGRASAAARQLGVEHTTVSRRVAALEADLGVPLFYRTSAGYQLTAHGEAVRRKAEEMEQAALAIGARARAGEDTIAGRVRVALLDEVASHWLAPLLPAFRALHPRIDLQVLVGIAPLDLSRGEAELAIRTPRPHQPGLSAVRLGRLSFALYASKALVGRRRLRVVEASSLGDLPLLVFCAPYDRAYQATWFQPVLAAAPIALSTNSNHTLIAATRAQLGVGALPHVCAAVYDDLVCVSDDLGGSDFWLTTHPEYRRDPRVRATAEFLRTAAAGPAFR
jgi:DNA-binding transcriptional LysR family regulator